MSKSADTVPLPALPIDFPELKTLSLDKLEQLEMNPLSLDDFISNMAIVQSYKKAKDDTDTRNIDICRNSISASSKIENTRMQISSVSNQMLQARERAQQSTADRELVMSKYTAKSLVKDLEQVRQSSDAATERLSGSFDTVEAVKAEFISQRILHHKAVALSDLISSVNQHKKSAV